MKIMSAVTNRPDIRSEIYAWTEEDSSQFVPNKPIGLTPGPKYYESPKTIMEALSNGWELLGPPQEHEGKSWCTWWLCKPSKRKIQTSSEWNEVRKFIEVYISRSPGSNDSMILRDVLVLMDNLERK
jgi:hypothetical protein